MLNPPSYYNIGNIYLNILCILEYNSNNTAPSIGTIGKRNITTGLFGLTRIRNNCSALHSDLFHANLIHNPSCSCGYSTENVDHFIVLQEVWCTKKYSVPFFISCKCTHWLKTPCCLEVKFIILTQIGMYSLLYRHILRKHVAFGLWLTWCECKYCNTHVWTLYVKILTE